MKVRFENVSLNYDKQKEVLHNLNFEIPNGKLTCLLGPSGCGKSTTLNLISGLLLPSAGKIYFDKQDVTKKDALDRRVGMVFQNYALYPHMTVLENICFPLKMAKVKKKDQLKRAQELAKLVHISNELDKHPGELSGGQQQRVAIARSLAKSPSILLLDEPLSNLDARLRVEMRDEIRKIQVATGVTTVFVTHDQDEAMHISDKIMILDTGEVQQYTTPNKIYDRPSNLFVAKFIGNPEVNVIPLADLKSEFASFIPNDILKNAVSLIVRPESIVSADSTQELLPVNFQGKLLSASRFGKETAVRMNFQGETILATAILKEKLEQKSESIHFRLKTTGVFLSDQAGKIIWSADGERIVNDD
ncbi:MAG: ABC transporter ATP-binding protein [Liquorilactobacillus ghanensis]|uniref:ABC transporter ATP-binding protein n=1 Tax=Liquorilactobacillus ghanensis TaxID=399370 RepID=UPI0039E7F513